LNRRGRGFRRRAHPLSCLRSGRFLVMTDPKSRISVLAKRPAADGPFPLAPAHAARPEAWTIERPDGLAGLLAKAESRRAKAVAEIGLLLADVERIRGLSRGDAGLDRPTDDGRPDLAALLLKDVAGLKSARTLLERMKGLPALGERLVSGSPGREAVAAHPKSVLVIDADATTLALLGHFLELGGFSVLAAETPEAGLRLARSERPDLIVLGLLLPGEDGFQVLAKLKRDGALAGIPVIIMSSLSREDGVIKAFESGAVEYFTKPFSPRIVLAKIRQILSSIP